LVFVAGDEICFAGKKRKEVGSEAKRRGDGS